MFDPPRDTPVIESRPDDRPQAAKTKPDGKERNAAEINAVSRNKATHASLLGT